MPDFANEVLSLLAKHLQAQAYFVQRLGSCSDPWELLRRQAEFIGAFWQAYVKECTKLWAPNNVLGERNGRMPTHITEPAAFHHSPPA